MRSVTKSKKKPQILLAVTGCIAAYKMPEFVRLLIKEEYSVKVILTELACQFVTPVTLATVSQNTVYRDTFDTVDEWYPAHIFLAQWADLFVMAPLSADMIGKIAGGFADNLLLNTLLAYSGSVLMAPSMNDQMYANEIVKKNIEQLQDISRYHFLDPDEGFLACLSEGSGRLPDLNVLVEKVKGLTYQ
jgi:phosphopantothenoylcysteine decarboxylase/phosphopantothenate--cysteine ligase